MSPQGRDERQKSLRSPGRGPSGVVVKGSDPDTEEIRGDRDGDTPGKTKRQVGSTNCSV